MAKKFTRLTAPEVRKLKHGDKPLSEHGITFQRAPNGDGVWTVNVMVDGQRIHRAVGRESEGVTRTQCEAFIEQARADARHGRLNLPRGRKTVRRFAEAADHYLEELEQTGGRNLPKKRQQLRLHLVPFFGAMPLSAITSGVIDRYKEDRLKQCVLPGNCQRIGSEPKRKVKPGTVNRELAVLSHLLHMAAEWKWIQHAPAKIKRFKEGEGRIVYLTVEQAERLREAATGDENPHVYLFTCIGLETSMRKMEILRLRREHVNLDRQSLYIPVAKGGSREQPITGSLADQLRAHLATLPADGAWLFPSGRSKAGHATAIEKAYRRVVKLAGLDPKMVVRHTLRHTAITHMVQAGVDLPTVQRVSGHKTLAMVARYAHANGAHIQAAMNALERRYHGAGTAERQPEPPKSVQGSSAIKLVRRTGTFG